MNISIVSGIALFLSMLSICASIANVILVCRYDKLLRDMRLKFAEDARLHARIERETIESICAMLSGDSED